MVLFNVVSFYKARQIVLAVFFLLMLAWVSYQMGTAPEPLKPYPAPAFSLTSVEGKTVSYPGKQGPALIVFSRPDDTPDEIELDIKALRHAHESQAKCWVIGTPEVPHAFKEINFATRGNDPKGEILARFPCREGQSAEWVVIDPSGEVRWSGTRSPMDLKAKLSAMQP